MFVRRITPEIKCKRSGLAFGAANVPTVLANSSYEIEHSTEIIQEVEGSIRRQRRQGGRFGLSLKKTVSYLTFLHFALPPWCHWSLVRWFTRRPCFLFAPGPCTLSSHPLARGYHFFWSRSGCPFSCTLWSCRSFSCPAVPADALDDTLVTSWKIHPCYRLSPSLIHPYNPIIGKYRILCAEMDAHQLSLPLWIRNTEHSGFFPTSLSFPPSYWIPPFFPAPYVMDLAISFQLNIPVHLTETVPSPTIPFRVLGRELKTNHSLPVVAVPFWSAKHHAVGKDATGHLKGVTIAVMGGIVNGPGEMADADFGYVGSGPGKIDLYVSRNRVKSAIPS